MMPGEFDMRAFSFLLTLMALATAAAAATSAPPPLDAPLEAWTSFTERAVAEGDFPGWRDALAEQLRAELPPSKISQIHSFGAALALEQWTFLRDVLAADADALDKVRAGNRGRDFLAWLLASREALGDYNGMAAVFPLKGKRRYGLDGWREIWATCSASRKPGLWRRVAAACAISFAEPRGNTTPAERFGIYRSSHAAGQLVPYFDKALPFELALTVHGSGCGNDDLEWAQDVTPRNQKNQNAVGNYGHSLMVYRSDNYRGQTVQGPEYYDRKPADLGTAMEYGGVCGMISHMNSSVANAHGVPAFTVGQPGHCAYVWKSNAKTWSGGNFITGWADTHDSHQQPFWLSQYSANINLVSAAVEAPGFAEAERLRALAAVWREKDARKAQAILAAATAADPLDYSAWRDRIETALAWKKASPALWSAMWTEITRSFAKFPLAMNDLLARFDTSRLLLSGKDAEKVARILATARALTAMPASEQWDLIDPAWKAWFGRQLAALGVPEQFVPAIVAGGVPEGTADVWGNLPRETRQGVESLFTALLPALKQDRTLYQQTTAAWLALVARDRAANARASKFFRAKLAAANDLGEIEMIADALLTATRTSADARAELVALIRKRIATVRQPDPARMDALLALLASHDFRAASRIGEWRGDRFANSGDQTLRWNLTPLLASAAGECSLSLSFRWTGGAPFVLKAARLFENDRELGADPTTKTADSSLRPAVVTLRVPKPKPGADYTLRATASGGGDSTGVVLSRSEATATFDKDKWGRVGGWGGKEIRAAPEVAAGWRELEFDATNCVRAPGEVFVVFKYDSYASPQVMNVRLFVGGRKVAGDLHSCNPISGANTMYALHVPSRLKSNAKVVIRALFTSADGWGSVYVREQVRQKTPRASRQ
jgi:hypothetical protein